MPGLPKLNRIDINILVQLQKDGAISNLLLAEQVGLSPSRCLQRVKRLEKAGYITGYGAQINLAKLTDSVTIFTEVTLIDHRIDDFTKFEANIRDVEELMECHLISGGYDYLLRFLTRSITHYQEQMEGLLRRNIGIEKYFWAREGGLLIIKCGVHRNVVRFLAPLVLSEEDLRQALAILDTALASTNP